MPLLVVVILLVVGGVIWRARTSRRLTIEQSVDQYRRTLTAVHEAAQRSRATDGSPGAPPVTPLSPPRRGRSRSPFPRARWGLVVALMLIATAATVVVVIVQNRDDGSPRVRTTTPTTKRSPPTSTTSTTTKPAPTTTVPLVTPTGTTGTSFTIAKASYTLNVQTTGACWIDARDPAGKSLFSGVVNPGQAQAITAGTMSMQLGNPAAVALTIDGTPVPFTVAGGGPVTLHFQGAAPAA